MTSVDDSSTSDPRAYDYGQPAFMCDLVMKGGITSGVVYPQAVCEIARDYRLRNIGGTSAGAIAAAAAAAAELGRAADGFAELAAIPNWIGHGENLQSLFQPQRQTRPLFRLLLAALVRGWTRPFRVFVAVVIGFPLATALGLAPGLLLLIAAVVSGRGALLVVAVACAIVLLLLGFVTTVLLAIARRLMRTVPDNYFGLCSGNSPPQAEVQALTPWLADELDRLARGDATRIEPLTFGELWSGPPGEQLMSGERWVNLEMMTTNLTNRRPERLPWPSHSISLTPSSSRTCSHRASSSGSASTLRLIPTRRLNGAIGGCDSHCCDR